MLLLITGFFRFIKPGIAFLLIGALLPVFSEAGVVTWKNEMSLAWQQPAAKADTTIQASDTASLKADSIRQSLIPTDTNKISHGLYLKDGIVPEHVALYPYSSLQQALKGNVAGLYVQETSGEPGTEMSMLIRGTALPYMNHKDIYHAQPTVILDGVPLINDDPFAFDIQLYDYNRIGPATNLLSSISMDDIASVKVVKDFAEASLYGPRAANGGVIIINTKAPVIGGRKISLNTYFGVVQRPSVYSTNARYENDFRQRFYDRYAGESELLNYPVWLRDSTNDAYWGPSNWPDLYYKNRIIRGADVSLSSGTERANYRFSMGNQQTNNPADDTRLDRYNAMFEINMVPVSWLTISSMISGTRLERDRNTGLRDRFAEMQYLPDLSSPLPPNKTDYQHYLDQIDNSFDENKSNVITGYFRLNFKFGEHFKYLSSLGFNYNEGLRDIFYPSTLMESVNYVSNYYGYSQRLTFNNTLSFNYNWNNIHTLTLEGGEIFEADFNRYNYTYAYKGPNDLIKANILNSDPNNSNYLTSKAFSRQLIYMFIDKLKHRLLSFYGRAQYQYKDLFDFSAMLRADGSSSALPDEYWLLSPTFSAGLNLKSLWLEDADAVGSLRLHGSWGRVGRLVTDDLFGEGAQYTSDLSFSNNPVKFSYDAFPGLSRPYSYGYIGDDLSWAYTDQADIGVDISLWKDRLTASLDVYSRVDKNMLVALPFSSEYGYTAKWENGMKVRNRGVDFTIMASVLPSESRLQWRPAVNINYNQNTLLALPEGTDELVIGEGANARLLKVGHAIDQYWLLQNDGIYNRERDIPVNPGTNAKITYEGIPIMAGDPKWKDLNGDGTINDEDKVLTGHYLPQVSGGFSNEFTYRNFTLNFSFYYALGRKVLNQEMADRFDFINREDQISMNAVKEITFWSKIGDYTHYPVYNPWSTVVPYRMDQDLWLENGSFLKLRSLSLQYDLTGAKWWNQKSIIRGLTVYGTANNLFTVTPYSGRDPELAYYDGVDGGYGLPIPRSYTIGIRMDF